MRARSRRHLLTTIYITSSPQFHACVDHSVGEAPPRLLRQEGSTRAMRFLCHLTRVLPETIYSLAPSGLPMDKQIPERRAHFLRVVFLCLLFEIVEEGVEL